MRAYVWLADLIAYWVLFKQEFTNALHPDLISKTTALKAQNFIYFYFSNNYNKPYLSP
jgi:hypothetical protein